MGSFQDFLKKRAEMIATVTHTLVSYLKQAGAGHRFVRRLPILYARYRRELAEFENTGLEGRRQLHEQKLKRMLSQAASVAAYAGQDLTSLDRLPLLTKEKLRQSGPKPYGTHKLLVTSAQTSGSSGVPLQLKRSFASVVYEQAALDHVAALAGADFHRDKIAILRGDRIKDPSDVEPPFWTYQGGGRVLNMSASHLNLSTCKAYRKALADFTPGILWAYPSALELLINTLSECGQDLQIPFVLCSSEVLPADLRRRAEAFLGCKLIDYYGQAERASLAYALDDSGYKFLAPYGHVELLPSETANHFKIVSTNLQNTAMILLRYDTGDIAVLDGPSNTLEMEEVALGLRPFVRIDGREADYLLLPDGTRLVGLNHIPRGLDGILQMQIVQTQTDAITVRVVPATGEGEDLRQRVLTAIRNRVPGTVNVTIDFCRALNRTKAGKIPFIVHAEQAG